MLHVVSFKGRMDVGGKGIVLAPKRKEKNPFKTYMHKY